MSIAVLKAPMHGTFQDFGRLNGVAQGVPICGVMDKKLAAFINSLLGNTQNEVVLEQAVIGGEFEFRVKTQIVIGAYENCAFLNNENINSCEIIQAEKGDVLKFKPLKTHRFVYLAVAGGFEAEQFFGSRSTYLFTNSGGFKGRALKKGDELMIKSQKEKKCTSIAERPALKAKFKLHPAPEFEYFTKVDKAALVANAFEIENDSNRMGFRLKNIELKGTASGNIISSGVLPGTLQVPPSGKPIVLMADGPCTGGYPRIAIIDNDDLSAFAQLLPNQKHQFYWANDYNY